MKPEGRWDYCQCEADVSYPVLAGVHDFTAVNAAIKAQATKLHCRGKAIEGSKLHGDIKKFSHQVVFNNHPVLTLSLLATTYGAGAAHSNYRTDYVVVSKMSGKQLGFTDMVDVSKLDELNGFIRSELAKSESTNASALDVNTSYVTKTGCDACVVGVDEKGVFLQFGLYTVAPFSAGEPKVYLPEQYVPAGDLHFIYRKAKGL
jgi:hypothetical protein